MLLGKFKRLFVMRQPDHKPLPASPASERVMIRCRNISFHFDAPDSILSEPFDTARSTPPQHTLWTPRCIRQAQLLQNLENIFVQPSNTRPCKL